MESLDIIRRLHQHRMWVNQQFRDLAKALTDQQLRQRFDVGQGSVFATLVHLYAAEAVWIAALTGNSNPPLVREDAFESLEELVITWTALDRRWQRYLEQLVPSMLEAQVHKVSSSSPGKAQVTRACDVLLHVCTHGQYTAAQLTNMLRQLGVSPLPDTMLITMARREASA